MNNPSNFLLFAKELAKEAGAIHMKYFGNISSLEKKSTNIDLVTKADLESEKYIINKINKKYPNHSILAEESGYTNKENEYQFFGDEVGFTQGVGLQFDVEFNNFSELIKKLKRNKKN